MADFHHKFEEVPDFWDSDFDGSMAAAKKAMNQRLREYAVSNAEIRLMRDQIKDCFLKSKTNYKKNCSSMVKQYLLRINNRETLPKLVSSDK